MKKLFVISLSCYLVIWLSSFSMAVTETAQEESINQPASEQEQGQPVEQQQVEEQPQPEAQPQAEEQPQLEEQPLEEQPQPEAEPQPETPQEQDGRISLDLQGVDINELFKMLSLKSGLTIITTPNVQGRVTVFLNNLAFEDALDVIITQQNLAYERKDNLVKIMTAQEYEDAYGRKFSEKKQVKIIKLKYAKPSNILAILTNFQSSLGKIIADDESGTLLINDTLQAIKLMEETIVELDQPLETMVFDINYAKVEDVKTHIENLVTPEVGKVITDDRSSKVIVTDLPKRLAKIKLLLTELDEESRQVLVTGEIIEITLYDRYYRGIDWEKLFSERLQDNLTFSGTFPSAGGSTGQQISVGTLTTDRYNVVLNILEQFGDTKTISRPRLVVVNKEEAQVLVGTREAYVTETTTQGDATQVVAESVEFIDVGVKLNVVPTIGKDGFITMKIKPEISSVSSTISTSGGNIIPIVATSEAETVVKVKDGTTVMIAGLLKETRSDTVSSVPFVSKIPILGKLLFSNRAVQKPYKTELVVFLTPQIITGEGQLVREAKSETEK